MKILSVKFDKELAINANDRAKNSWTADEAHLVIAGDWVVILSKRENRAYAVHGSHCLLVLDAADARDLILEDQTAPAPKRKAS